MMRSRPEAFRIAGREVIAQRKDGTEFRVSVSFGDVQVGRAPPVHRPDA
jgi:hypothetical protein